MGKNEFLWYLSDKYNISKDAFRLINNILDFVENKAANQVEQHHMLSQILCSTAGITETDIQQVHL